MLEDRVAKLEDDLAFVARAIKALSGGGYGAGGRFSGADHERLQRLVEEAQTRCDAS